MQEVTLNAYKAQQIMSYIFQEKLMNHSRMYYMLLGQRNCLWKALLVNDEYNFIEIQTAYATKII